jgi:hypothetical protein
MIDENVAGIYHLEDEKPATIKARLRRAARNLGIENLKTVVRGSDVIFMLEKKPNKKRLPIRTSKQSGGKIATKRQNVSQEQTTLFEIEENMHSATQPEINMRLEIETHGETSSDAIMDADEVTEMATINVTQSETQRGTNASGSIPTPPVEASPKLETGYVTFDEEEVAGTEINLEKETAIPGTTLEETESGEDEADAFTSNLTPLTKESSNVETDALTPGEEDSEAEAQLEAEFVMDKAIFEEAESDSGPIGSEAAPSIEESPSSEIDLLTFDEEWQEALIRSRKVCDIREQYYPGDTFEAFGDEYIITKKQQIPLNEVAVGWFKENGFYSTREFKEVWKESHNGKFDPEHVVWLYHFRKAFETPIAQEENAFTYSHAACRKAPVQIDGNAANICVIMYYS